MASTKGKLVIGCLGLWGLSIFLNGCATSYNISYNIVLKEVESPIKTKERYAERKITKVDNTGNIFEDEVIKIVWFPTSRQVSFFLTNKTDYSIKILWDEAAFVDERGNCHRVIHAGVKYIDRNNSQPPSVVVRKGFIEDSVVPTGIPANIYWAYGDWHERPLFPTTASGVTAKKAKKKVEKYIGETMQVLLPIETEGIVNDYIFTLKIKDIEVKEQERVR